MAGGWDAICRNLSFQDFSKFGDVFTSAHGEVGFAAAFAADLSGESLHDLAGGVARLDSARRAEGNEAGFVAKCGPELHDTLTEFGQHLRAERAE